MIQAPPDEAAALVEKLAARSWKLALAESCTGGLASELLARVPGASRVFWGSFVSYSPGAKIAMLGLEASLIEGFGAVSRETALAMAEGALLRSGADAAGAVTGLAGPGGDGSPLPLGTVWIASALRGAPAEARVFRFPGSRNEVRAAAAAALLRELLKRL
jgi:PncC family amidohydrolase